MRGVCGRRRPSGVARGLLGLVTAYVGLTFAGTWACWGLSALLTQVVVPSLAAPGGAAAGGFAGALGPLAGALQVMGTLVPAVVAYALFPRVRALGLAGPVNGRPLDTRCAKSVDGGDDPRAGFWAFAFGTRPRLGGWLFFVVLAVWRWAMFRAALGFPETPEAALVHFVTALPMLLLGGGFEEIGWRGLLQPALMRLLEGRGAPNIARGASVVRSAAHPGEGSAHSGGAVRPVVAALLVPLLVGAIWACWHLPLFAMPGTYQHGLAFLPFAGIAVALSYSLGALRALTGGPLACILGHAWYNAMLVAPLAPLMVGAVGEALAGQAALFGALFALEAVAGAAILVAHTVRKPRIVTR